MRRNALDLARYLAALDALFNERLRGRARLTQRPFRTPAGPVAILATLDQSCPSGPRSLKGRYTVAKFN